MRLNLSIAQGDRGQQGHSGACGDNSMDQSQHPAEPGGGRLTCEGERVPGRMGPWQVTWMACSGRTRTQSPSCFRSLRLEAGQPPLTFAITMSLDLTAPTSTARGDREAGHVDINKGGCPQERRDSLQLSATLIPLVCAGCSLSARRSPGTRAVALADLLSSLTRPGHCCGLRGGA